MKNILFLLNYPPHYRSVIYKKIESELNADFYFGDIPNSSIKKIDFKQFNNVIKTLETLKIKQFYWYRGVVKIFFKPYKKIILTGDPFILSNWVLLILGKIFNKKVYLWTHGWYGREKGIKKIIKKVYFKLAYKLFLYGEASKRLLLENGFSDNRLLVIYNSLDYESQLRLRNKLSKSNIYSDYFKNDLPVIIFIGRLQADKKIEMLIDLLRLASINLVLVGGFDTIDYQNTILDKINFYDISHRVYLYGPCYDELTNANLIFNADVCISPGNIGLTTIHSLMFGTPVITHNNFTTHGPEYECIIEGVNGGFFEEDNLLALLKKLDSILEMNINLKDCCQIIDNKWNPINQITIFKNELL